MDFDFLIRALILIILLISFSISAFYRKKARDESGTIKRQEEGWFALILRLGFALPLLTVLLLNIFYPAALSWAHFSSPFYLQIIGLILAMLCVPFLWWVLSTIGKNISETVLTKHSHELVISGPYAKVRHPLYSGAIILLFAISLVFGDWIILGYSIVSLLAFRLLIIPTEEKQLLEAFGEDYEYYQARTGALLPWIR